MFAPLCSNRHSARRLLGIGLVLAALFAPMRLAIAAQAPPWTEVVESRIRETGRRLIQPDIYRIVAVDNVSLGQILASAPMEGTTRAQNAPLALDLPLPDGSTATFHVVESPILAPELGARYPEIHTYQGRLATDPGVRARLDRTPHGFHAMVFMREGTAYIDPYQQGDVTHYVVHWRKDLHPTGERFRCGVVEETSIVEEIGGMEGASASAHGTQLRTYRAAIATTGEYTALCGGTVPLGLAAVTTVMNRVSAIYEYEVSVRMVLVPNNHLLIYTDPANDPYTNNDEMAMLNQNQTNLDIVIGSANYDIGHVFSTSGFGFANGGVVCRNGLKARGETGWEPPVGDGFTLVVCHEMGHMFSALHGLNGTAGLCLGARNESTAYEPGSGSTIMCYAGLCEDQDLQPLGDTYFNWNSSNAIMAYTTQGLGNGCPVITPTGVVEPTVTAPASGFFIPINTPFSLTASATTVGTPTFCWEEADLGPAGHPNFPVDNAPIFRSFPGSLSPTRIFPKLSDILNNTQTLGELLPSYSRILSFVITVRDEQVGGVGIRRGFVTFSATSTAGPFQITSPNTEGIVYPGGTTQTVTWNLANTNVGPVNCQTVSIRLSTDGGANFDTILAAGTANDGTQMVVIPDTPTLAGRIQVQAADNIFFDINDFNFRIDVPEAVSEPAAVAGTGLPVLYESRPNPFNPQTAIIFELPKVSVASLRVYDLAGRLVATLADGQLAAGRHEISWNGADAGGEAVAAGVYFYRLETEGFSQVRRFVKLR